MGVFHFAIEILSMQDGSENVPQERVVLSMANKTRNYEIRRRHIYESKRRKVIIERIDRSENKNVSHAKICNRSELHPNNVPSELPAQGELIHLLDPSQWIYPINGSK